MLGVTTNISGGLPANSNGLIDDDMMDPLFDDDWLHEHNLDLLFDLFEEEMKSKGVDVANNGSSTIFGTSPVTSYLFGTSPSLASALDLYDLLCFDNQQPITSTQHQYQQTTTTSTTNATNHSTATTTTAATSTITINGNNIEAASLNSCAHNQINNTFCAASGPNSVGCNPNYGGAQQVNQISTNHIANSITNAMRIKRKLKKGQSEGVSLLARPLACNSNGNNSGSSKTSKGSNNNNISNIIHDNNNNNSDKTSGKITNFKRSIIANNRTSAGVDINYSKQSQQNRDRHIQHHHLHHKHHITGCAVIREHAYAVRGH